MLPCHFLPLLSSCPFTHVCVRAFVIASRSSDTVLLFSLSCLVRDPRAVVRPSANISSTLYSVSPMVTSYGTVVQYHRRDPESVRPTDLTKVFSVFLMLSGGVCMCVCVVQFNSITNVGSHIHNLSQDTEQSHSGALAWPLHSHPFLSTMSPPHP